MIQHRIHDRSGHVELVAGMAPWDAAGGPVPPGPHPGDLGWALRDTEGLDVHGWWDDDRLVAVALSDPTFARLRLAPSLGDDDDVAAAVADVVDRGATTGAEVEPGTALHRALSYRGWAPDADPWVCLFLDLTTWSGPDEPVVVDLASTCPEDRVSAQLAGFDNSTFTLEKWQRMAAGPAYDAGLDLVVRAADGSPAATGTAWLVAEGGTAVLEPVSTHRDHRRAGHGRRLLHALADACRERGARGLNVWTPQRNEGGVAAYVAAGFEVVDAVVGMEVKR